jgi:hypothetical protein
MTDEQRKRLTKYLGEKWYECNIPPCTHEKNCCYNRTFDTWQDLGAVKEKLVEKGDWFRRFKSYAASKWLDDEDEMERYEISDVAAFMVWLFRPIDENVNPHFCRLVAEWLENNKHP